MRRSSLGSPPPPIGIITMLWGIAKCLLEIAITCSNLDSETEPASKIAECSLPFLCMEDNQWSWKTSCRQMSLRSQHRDERGMAPGNSEIRTCDLS